MENSNLVERLTQLSSDEPLLKQEIVRILRLPPIDPRRQFADLPRLKDDLAQRIYNFFVFEKDLPFESGPNFARTIESSINKDPLKNVEYGIRSAHEMPTSFLSAFPDWGRLYLMAGVFGVHQFRPGKTDTRWKTIEPLLDDMNIAEIGAIYTRTGMETLERSHMIRVGLQNRDRASRGRTYTTDISLPYARQIRDQIRNITMRSVKASVTKANVHSEEHPYNSNNDARTHIRRTYQRVDELSSQQTDTMELFPTTPPPSEEECNRTEQHLKERLRKCSPSQLQHIIKTAPEKMRESLFTTHIPQESLKRVSPGFLAEYLPAEKLREIFY